jgi:hypothetical protein
MNKFLYYILRPLRWYKDRQERKRRLDELRKQDPFIYK